MRRPAQLNGSKYVYDVTTNDIVRQVIKVILDIPHAIAGKHLEFDGIEYTTSVPKIFEKFVPILEHYVRDESTEREALDTMEAYETVNHGPMIIDILHFLLNKKI